MIGVNFNIVYLSSTSTGGPLFLIVLIPVSLLYQQVAEVEPEAIEGFGI